MILNFSSEFSSYLSFVSTKFTYHILDIPAKIECQLKIAYGKGGNSLNNDFKSTSLPACDSGFSFQPCILFHTGSLIQFKIARFFLPTTAKRPRYFSFSLISRTPRNSLIASLEAVETNFLKKRFVFCRFIC